MLPCTLLSLLNAYLECYSYVVICYVFVVTSVLYAYIHVYLCRAQTVILIDMDNHVTYVERALVSQGGKQHHTTTKSIKFDLCTNL